MKVDDPVVFLYSPQNPIELQLLKSMLSDAGIPIEIYDEAISSVYHLPNLRTRIMVKPNYLAEARKIVTEYEKNRQHQKLDDNYRDADLEDIAYEKSVNDYEQQLSNAGPGILIVILIIMGIVSLYLLIAFL